MRSIRNTPPFGDPIGSHKRFISIVLKDDFKKGKLDRNTLFGFFDKIFKYFFGRFSGKLNV